MALGPRVLSRNGGRWDCSVAMLPMFRQDSWLGMGALVMVTMTAPAMVAVLMMTVMMTVVLVVVKHVCAVMRVNRVKAANCGRGRWLGDDLLDLIDVSCDRLVAFASINITARMIFGMAVICLVVLITVPRVIPSIRIARRPFLGASGGLIAMLALTLSMALSLALPTTG